MRTPHSDRDIHRSPHSRAFGVFCLVLSASIWAATPLFVKYFSLQGIEADVQNLFRYLSATMGLWLLVLTRFPREAVRALKRWPIFLLPVSINCIFQVTMVSGLYRQSIYPGLMSLLSKSSTIFAVVLAFLIFRDERRTILSRRYLIGCALGVAGVVGVVMCAAEARADFNEGVFLVVLASFLWACYTLAMKRVVKGTRPLVAFTVIATWTTLFFLLLAVARSHPARFFSTVSMRDQVLVFVSGVLCIAVTHSLYFRAVERLGIAICASFLLIQPLITGVLSWFVFKETLTAGQMLMGVVLLTGAYLVIRAGRDQPASAVTVRAGKGAEGN